MLTPEGVIREARDLSPSYEERLHPNGVMLRALDSYERVVAAEVARKYPPTLAQIINIPLPLVPFEDGIPLVFQSDPQPPDPDAPPPQGIIYVMPGMVLSGTSGGTVQEAEIVNMSLRNRPADYCGRVGYLQRDRLYLSGSAKSWIGFTNIELNVIPNPLPITGMDDVLQMPDWTSNLYVGQLVKIMGARERDEAGVAIGAGLQDAVWTALVQQKGAESFVTVDTWPGGY